VIRTIGGGLPQIPVDRLMQLRADDRPPGNYYLITFSEEVALAARNRSLPDCPQSLVFGMYGPPPRRKRKVRIAGKVCAYVYGLVGVF
jgi:hypothetical protein